MKLLGSRADKLASLEEGPIIHQYPESGIRTPIAPRGHLERCIQMLKLIFYFELILLIGWIGCLYLSNYYGGPSTVVDVPHNKSNWMDNSDSVNDDGFNRENLSPLSEPLIGGHSLENQFAQSELAEASTSEEDNQTMAVLLLLSMFDDLTQPPISDNDASSDVNDWGKNEDREDDESSVIIKDINLDEQFETTTEANMSDDDDSVIAIGNSEFPIIDQTLTEPLTENHSSKNQFVDSELTESSTAEDDKQAMSVLFLLSIFDGLTYPKVSDDDALIDVNNWEKIDGRVGDEQIETTTEANMNEDDESVIAIEKSEIPIIDQTQESADYLWKWLPTISNMESIDNDEYLDDSDEWGNWEPKLDAADTPDEEKIIDTSNYFDETELDKLFEDRIKRFMAKIGEDVKARLSNKEKLEISPIYSVPHPDRIDDLSGPPMQRQVFNPEISRAFPDLTELDTEPSDDYGNLEWYQKPQHDKDDVISRLAREIGTKVDSDSNSSSDEGTTPSPKVKRSIESSSEESSESNEKPQPSDSSLTNDKVTEISTKILTINPDPNDPNQNGTRLSEKDFENIVSSF